MARRQKFEAALDDACDELMRELGRNPGLDEMEGLRQRLFQSWMESGKFDELIAYVHDYYELDGGISDCSILSEALRKRGDLERIEKLFQGLISVRTAAFWRVWPKAETGHIGAMRESAKCMSLAMEAYAGLWHGYWSLDDEAGQLRTQQEMLRLQARAQPASAKQDGSKIAKAKGSE